MEAPLRPFARPVLAALAAAVLLGACGGGDDGDATPTTADAAGWDADAIAVAEGLAADIRAADITCDDFAPANHAVLAADYEGKLPLPAGYANCVGPGGEDFTFEVFADTAARDDFLVTKMRLVCAGAESAGIGGSEFPGVPYVEGDPWLIEPDDAGTADLLAPAVEGTSKLATCPDTPGTTPASPAPTTAPPTTAG